MQPQHRLCSALIKNESYIDSANNTVDQRVLRGWCDERAMDGERRS